MNIIKGTLYEIFINKYLNETENSKSWLWKNIPECHLRKSNLLGDWNENRLKNKEIKNMSEKEKKENDLIDLGCDILLEKDDKYFIIQCKNYDIKNSVKIPDLAGFYFMMIHHNLDGKLFYTSKLSKNLKCPKPTDKVEYIKKIFDENNEGKEGKEINNTLNLIDNAYDYQIDACKKINAKRYGS